MKFKSNVAITFRQEHDYLMYPQKGWWSDEAETSHFGPKTKYTMEVRSSEFFADVSIGVHNSFLSLKDAIASCLVAGLKLIDGYEMVYDEVISQFRNHLGIRVSREVGKEVAELTKMYFSTTDIPHYIIDIPLGLGFYNPKVSDMTAHHFPDKFKIKLECKVHSRGNNFTISDMVDDEMWHYGASDCMKFMQARFLSELHRRAPHLGMDWEIIRKQWFGDSQEMQKKGFDSYVSPNFQSAGDLWASHPNPPKDVAKLPGVREKVKHPISGRQVPLWNVIVDLNDAQGWSRGQIADWVETLDIDISFGSKNEQD